MKNLRRNGTEFEYIPNTGQETDVNADGDHTGEFHPVYGDPVKYRGNISSPSGQTVQAFYGVEIRYTHTLVMDNPNVDIQETGLIRWKGNLYDIKAVRPTINAISFALRRQTEGETDGTVYSEEHPDDTGSVVNQSSDP